MSNSSIWPMDMTLSGALTLNLSGPGSNHNVRVPCIPQSCSITGASPFDCLVSYRRHSIVVVYYRSRLSPRTLVRGGVLFICRGAVAVFYSPSRLGSRHSWGVETYSSAEMQSLYSTTSADWTVWWKEIFNLFVH